MFTAIRKSKALKILLIIFGVILILAAAVFLFLELWPAFGGRATKEEKRNYENRAENYYDGEFHNESYTELLSDTNETDVYKLSEKSEVPQDDIPVSTPKLDEDISIDELNVTWLGHSSVLIQMHGMNILVDPVFSEVASPVSFVGIKRFSDLPLTAEELPQIDVVIITHDHYDHLDYNTIKDIHSKVDLFIVPLGIENHLERWGVDSDKIHNMAWWEEVDVNGLTIACTPANHYSSRSLNDRNQTLWTSWVLKDEYHQVYDSGDTGFGGHFKEIHDKYGDFDLALLDCAQYDMQWKEIHMFPEQSVNAAKILGADVAMPIHWGTFKLANHGWDDPPQRFVKAAEENSIPVISPEIGEIMHFDSYTDYMTRWWTELN